jgi:hypothetical protein
MNAICSSQYALCILHLRARLALALLCLMAFAPLGLEAQTTAYPPERIAYQGFATDGNGVALATNAPKNYDIVFRIWNDPTVATLTNRLWAEVQTVTVDKGYFSVLLGEGSTNAGEPRPTLSALFAAANASDRYVEMTVLGIGTGGAPVTILPRLRLLASPYAFLARSAGKLTSSSGTDLVISSGGGIAVNGPIVGSINGSNLVAGSVSSAQLAANSVTSAAIAPGAVGSSDIAAGAVGTAQIAAGAVGTAQIAANAITSGLIADGAVGASEIADGSVGAAEIADHSITATELATNLVLPSLELSGGLKIDGAGNALEFGAGITNKEINNGKIGYELFGNHDSLDIVGAGVDLNSRRIQFYGLVDVNGGELMTMGNDLYDNRAVTQSGSTYIDRDTTAGDAYLRTFGPFGDAAFGQGTGTSYRTTVGINCNHYIATAKGFVSYSDRRIKRDLQTSVTAKDLAAIEKLRVTDYRMVDPADGGRAWRKGFIAQEVEEVIPGAVKRTVDFVPDIFSLATNLVYDSAAKTLAVSLTKEHGLQAGDRVRLHLDGVRLDLNVSALPSAHQFIVEKCDRAPQKVFVYGREVSDFRTVDYDRIFTTGIGAIQELAKKVVAQGAELDELRAEVTKLRSERKTLEQSVSNLETRDQAREARLARLEFMLEKGRMGAKVKSESRGPREVQPASYSTTSPAAISRGEGAGEFSALAK